MWLPRYHRPSTSNLQNAKLINPKVHAFASRMHGYHLEVPLIKARVIYIITFSDILYNLQKWSSQVSITTYLPSTFDNPKKAIILIQNARELGNPQGVCICIENAWSSYWGEANQSWEKTKYYILWDSLQLVEMQLPQSQQHYVPTNPQEWIIPKLHQAAITFAFNMHRDGHSWGYYQSKQRQNRRQNCLENGKFEQESPCTLTTQDLDIFQSYQRPSSRTSYLQTAELSNPKVHAYHHYHLEVKPIKAGRNLKITSSDILYNLQKCSSQKVSSTMYLVTFKNG